MPKREPRRRYLILGGTKFIGREIARQARAAGHDVTLFNRGLTVANVDEPTIRGDVDRLLESKDALRDLKRYDEAAQFFARLLAVAPQQPYAPGMLLASRLDHCDWTDYEASSAAIEAAIESGKRADAPFSFFSHSASPKAQLDCARLFVAAEYPTGVAPLAAGPLERRERIRLAYVSADFHEHATAYLMAELFERHDRGRFEITGISYGPAFGIDDSTVIEGD